MHTLLGLSAPEKDDEILTAPNPYQTELNTHGALSGSIALNASDVSSYASDDDELPEENEQDFIAITDDIAAVLEQAADKATDFTSFEAELEKLVTGWSPEKIARTMAIAFFKARAEGDANFDKEDE